MNYSFAGLSVDAFETVKFTIPGWVILLAGALVILGMLFYRWRCLRSRTAAISYSDVRIVKRAARSARQRFRFLLVVLRLLAIAAVFIALARPRSSTEYVEISSEGVDIILAVDVSTSMQAVGFKPGDRVHTRLDVAKDEMKKFVARRVNDRIGLVVFARHSFTQCPLTTDYDVLLDFIDQVDFGMIEDGTAIGMALANSINRLRDSEAESKLIVLLTDGDNNAGEIDPLTAANLAKTFDVKVYTIGAGRPGDAMYPVQDPLFGTRYIQRPTRIDEATLRQIAESTGGEYYRAKSGEELEQIYTLIDQMEKTEVETTTHVQYQELFLYFVGIGFLLLIVEVLLGSTILRKLP